MFFLDFLRIFLEHTWEILQLKIEKKNYLNVSLSLSLSLSLLYLIIKITVLILINSFFFHGKGNKNI
jgi:hypothetical protein